MKTKLTRKNFLSITVHRDREVIEFLNSLEEVVFLTERVWTPSDIEGNPEVTSRILNFWEELGLIDDVRQDKKGWRRYSLVESLWLQIVLELKKFMANNNKILEAKDDLLKQGNEFLDNEGKMGTNVLFMYYVSGMLFLDIQVSLLVFTNGEALFVAEHERPYINFDSFYGNHISINLNHLLERCIPQYHFSNTNNTFYLTKGEKELLKKLRNEDLEKISIELEHGKIDKIRSEERKNSDTPLSEVLKSSDYQDIEIKRRDGKIVLIRSTDIKKV